MIRQRERSRFYRRELDGMAFRILLRLTVGALALSASTGVGRTDPAAQRPVGVVELFTSQGCNSCPPADELFAELAADPGIVALAYHVDYWDYLGWKDTLSSKENTERQYEYMRAFNSRSVYTPQAVINGRTHVSGASRSAVDGALSGMAKTGEGMLVSVEVGRTDDGVVIDAGEGDLAANAHVVLVFFEPPHTVRIDKGENDGRDLTYWNAVTSVQTAGMWHGRAQRYELPMSEIAKKKGGCAVLLQSVGPEGLPGPILGAAVIRQPTQ
jgi:hypothetical protein